MRRGAWLVACALAPQCVLAQDETATAAAELPPVEVRASASALPPALDQAPASVTRVERDVLAEGQYQVNLSETLARVPGLVVNNRQNYAQDLQLSLRGFGARASFGVRGLRLYTDGIPATMPDGQGQVSHFDLASAERITVLRGPFSALYGSSSGGVVEVTTLAPDRAFAEDTAWAAEDGARRLATTGALAGEGWSVLGSGAWFDTRGYRAHSAATRLGGQARAELEAGGGSLVLLGNAMDVEAQDPLGLTRAQWQADPQQAGTRAQEYNTRKGVTQAQLGAAWTPGLGGAQALRAVAWAGTRETRQFQSIPDTVQGTLATNPTHPGGVIDLDRRYGGADLRWLGRFGALHVAAGADAEFMAERRQGYQNFTGTPGPASTKGVLGPLRRDEDNTALALDPYAQAQWGFAPQWSALAGLRYATVRFASDDRFIVPATANGDDSGAVDFESLLPVAAVRWGDRGLSVHVAASRGAETPTLNELAYRPDGTAGLNDRLVPARSRNYELGAGWNGEGLDAELALFHIDTKDEIVVAGSAGGRTTFRNAAMTVRDGVEAAARWQPHPMLATALAWTWIDARYEGFAADNRLPGVPRHTTFAELEWRPLPQRLGVAVEALHRGSVAVNDAGTDAAPEYAVFNARVTARLTGGIELFARADNVADRGYAGSVIVNESNGRFFEPAPGRTFGAGVRVRFGAGG
jgi:iron complex outermembrane recepter protein